jgi:hypothetical protein
LKELYDNTAFDGIKVAARGKDEYTAFSCQIVRNYSIWKLKARPKENSRHNVSI